MPKILRVRAPQNEKEEWWVRKWQITGMDQPIGSCMTASS
jgi:hypothetical protein